MHCINATSPRHISVKKLRVIHYQDTFLLKSYVDIKITKAGKYPTSHFSLINLYLTAFYSLKKGAYPKHSHVVFCHDK